MEELSDMQVEIYRKMSFQQKWEICLSLQKMARELRFQGLKAAHPDATDGELWKMLAKEWTCART